MGVFALPGVPGLPSLVKGGTTLADLLNWNFAAGIPADFAALHSRASAATYVDSSGLIQSAAIDTPRLQHDASGNPLGYLHEPAATNRLTHSANFAVWANISEASVVASGETSPNGTTDAFKFVENTANDEHRLADNSLFSSGANYTASFFVKAAERTQVALWGQGLPMNGINAFFDLSAGTVISSGGAGFVSADMKDFGNGWWRVWAVGTAQSSGIAAMALRLAVAGTSTYLGDGSSGVHVWGAQVEAGTAPTSIIHTNGAMATRQADSLADYTFPGPLPSGVALLDYDIFAPPSGDTSVLDVSDGTTNNQAWIFHRASQAHKLSMLTRSGGVRDDIVTNGSAPSEGAIKAVVVWGPDGNAHYANGLDLGGPPITYNPSSVDKLTILQTGLNATIRRLRVMPYSARGQAQSLTAP